MFRNKILLRACPPCSSFLLLTLTLSQPFPNRFALHALCGKLSRSLRLACLPQYPDIYLVYQSGSRRRGLSLRICLLFLRFSSRSVKLLLQRCQAKSAQRALQELTEDHSHTTSSCVLPTLCEDHIIGKFARLDEIAGRNWKRDTTKASTIRRGAEQHGLHCSLDGINRSQPKKRAKPHLEQSEITVKVIHYHAKGQLGSLSVPELKAFLSWRKAKVGGKKEDLLKRVISLIG